MLFRKQACKGLLLYSFLIVIPATAFSLDVESPHLLSTALSRHLASTLIHDAMKALASDSLPYYRETVTIPLNKHVTGFVKTYLEKEEDYLEKMRSKSRQFFQSIEQIFTQYGLPPQLKYLAIVESGLKPNALSSAGARGLWQLMPGTARELGLKISGKTDQRLHAYRSTVAAARYLRTLYSSFGDWLLVLAAYNSGPGTVYAAMKKARSKNFWALQRYLPFESRGHVKRFIGIHFFFEGEGSITTQTRAEAKAWQEKWCAEQEARQQEVFVRTPLVLNSQQESFFCLHNGSMLCTL